uniref:GPI transamidase component PIG-S n=1 Tax=Timema cristinae TaxID=61476 RepID=A0A7R9D5E3_TIMCR|nr:unnamed protein product [Timema cristinae]
MEYLRVWSISITDTFEIESLGVAPYSVLSFMISKGAHKALSTINTVVTPVASKHLSVYGSKAFLAMVRELDHTCQGNPVLFNMDHSLKSSSQLLYLAMANETTDSLATIGAFILMRTHIYFGVIGSPKQSVSTSLWKVKVEIVNSFETVKMETEKLFMNSGDGDKNTKSAEEGTEKSRIYAALAFFGIMIVIGVPLWWKTTEVYRVSLPYSRIAALEKLDIFIGFNLTIVLSDINKDLSRFTSVKNEILVSSQRTIFFSPQTEAPKLYDVLQQWWFRETSLQKMVDSMITPTKADQDEIGRRRIPATKEYDILLTFINPDPDKLQVHWDLGNTIRKYLEPFLYKLSMLASYKVKSQWLYFVSLEVQPKLVTESSGVGQHYALAQDLLPHIITPLEKKLASHISHNPSLNFVVYMPTCDAAPLHIYRRQGMRVGLNAFLSPRWGGIVIHNPSASICQNDSIPEPKLVQPDSGAIMGIVLAQLKLLMGVPEIEKINKVEILTHSNEDLYYWELDFLLRVRTLEQLTSAKITLLSLSQLLGEISNIVINDDVGKSIYRAVDNVEYATSMLKMGELKAAFQASKQAFLSAESAFTDPSLLALLYFPDDQKYAVYIPLFLPVMIPVLMSLRNIYKFFKKNKAGEKLKFE